MTSAPMLQYLIPHGGGSLMPHGGGSLKSRQSHCGEGDVPVQEPSTMLMMLKIVYQLSPSSDGTHLYDNVDADADNLRCSSRLICRQNTAWGWKMIWGNTHTILSVLHVLVVAVVRRSSSDYFPNLLRRASGVTWGSKFYLVLCDLYLQLAKAMRGEVWRS